MTERLSDSTISLALESLGFTLARFRNYTEYPSYEFKLQRMQAVDDAMRELRAIRRHVTTVEVESAASG